MKKLIPVKMMIFTQKTLAIMAMAAIAAPAWAGLAWNKELDEFTAKIGAEVVRTSFCFTNTGKTTVSIIDIKPSCGCVTTALDKMNYAPGEGGEIKVTFDLGMDEFAKLQKRTIEVTTSDAPKNPSVLKLRVHVPETVSATPEIIIWHHGDKPKTKEVILKAARGIEPIKLTQTTSNDNFNVEVKPEIEGQRYRLKITPLKTDAPSYAELKFAVESASFAHRVDCEVHLNVE